MKPELPQREGWPGRFARLAPVVFVISIICLAWRITLGVDFSDEAYYAIFLDDWLKEGVAAAPFLTLHQTSALLVYPFAYAYRVLVGSTGGLMLFLRCLYVAGSATAALAVVRFLRLAGVGGLRWMAGALLVTFVPYNLPAPSYNTIGLQALLVACALFACAVLRDQAGQPSRRDLILSAVAWSVATVAYPSLILSLALLVVGTLILLRPGRTFAWFGLAAIAIGQALAGGTMLGILGWQRISRCLRFQVVVSSTLDAPALVARTLAILRGHERFMVLLMVAVLLGLLRKQLPAAAAAIVDALLLGLILLLPPALFSLSHGAILASALGGVLLLAGLRPRAAPHAKLLGLLFATSWVAGFSVAGTATLGVYKLPIGVALASVLAAVVAGERCLAAGKPLLATLPAGALWAVLMVSLWQSYYGEPPEARLQHRVRVGRGAFAGLAVTSDDARLIEVVQQALHQHERAGDTIAVAGRLPGLYLLSSARVRSLMPYALTALYPPAARRAIHDYYARPADRPSLVLIYRDPQLPVTDPFEPDFARWYRLRASYPTPLGSIELYRRVDEPA